MSSAVALAISRALSGGVRLRDDAIEVSESGLRSVLRALQRGKQKSIDQVFRDTERNMCYKYL